MLKRSRGAGIDAFPEKPLLSHPAVSVEFPISLVKPGIFFRGDDLYDSQQVGIPEAGPFEYKGFVFIFCEKFPTHAFHSFNLKYSLII